MAVQAVFQADFTNFNAGVQQADAALKKFEGSSRTTEAQLQKMTTTTAGTTSQTQSLTESYRQVDGVLQAAGIHMGPQVKALEDIANAAGKSASQLGLLGTAGLTVGTAMAAWNLGRAIADFFKLDEAISQATATLLGWGNLVAETAGAKQDVINRAIAQGAKETITYTEAIKFNEAALKQHTAAGIDWRAKLSEAQAEVRGLTAAQREEIAIAQQAGATTEQLTAKYHISKQGLEELAASNKVTAAAVAKHTAEMEKASAAAAKLDADYAKLMSDANNRAGLMKMEADADAMATAAKAQSQHTVNLLQNAYGELAKQQAATKASAVELGAAEQQVEADYQMTVTAAQQLTAAHAEVGSAAQAGTQVAVAGYQQVSQQVQLTTDNVRALIALNAYSAKANAILSEGLYTTASQRERVANLSSGLGGGGATSVTNTFNLSGSDPDTLARKVSEQILRTVRSGTQLGTA